MSVHYKFKSAVEYDTLPVDGLNISLGDLKEAIIQQKRLGKGQPYDLQITNAETKEVYYDEKKLIPKNSSLIVARVPIDPSQMKRPWENKEATALILANPSNLMNTEDAAEVAEMDRKIKEVTDLTRMEGSEQDKINAMVAQSTMEYHPSKYVKLRASKMTGSVPSGYKCYKCNQSGHWVTMCPLNNQDLMKSTGIPSMFLEEVADATAPGVMISASGKLVRLRDIVSNKNIGVALPPTERQPTPEELECLLCKELLKDAVLIPCCAAAFCDECIRNHLLDSEEHDCPTCGKEGIGPDTLIPNRYLRIRVQQFEFGYYFGDKKTDASSDVSDSLSAVPAHVLQTRNTPTPPPHSPAHSASPARIRISDKLATSPISETPCSPTNESAIGSPISQTAASPAHEKSPSRIRVIEPIGNGNVESDKENIVNEITVKTEEIRDAQNEHEGELLEEHSDREKQLNAKDKENIDMNEVDDADIDEKPKKIKKKKGKRKNSRHESDDEKEKDRKKRERRSSHKSQDKKVSSLEKKSKHRGMELLKDVADLPDEAAELWDDDNMADKMSHKRDEGESTTPTKKKRKHRNSKDMLLKDVAADSDDGEEEEEQQLWNDIRPKMESTEVKTRSRSNSGEKEKENTTLFDNIVPFNPRVPPPNVFVKSPPQDYRYPVTAAAFVPQVPPPPHSVPVPVSAENTYPHYQPGIPPPTITNPPLSYPRHHSSYAERELIADPLTEFEKHMREKDERDRKWRYSRSRSPSRSPRYRRVRSRSRQRNSWSRSRSRSLSRPRGGVPIHSPRSPSRRRWSRSPPPRGHASYRSRSPSFPREHSVSNRSLSLSRTPSPCRRIKTSPLHIGRVHPPKHPDSHALARPSIDYGAQRDFNRYPMTSLPHEQFTHQPPPYHPNTPHWDPHTSRYNQPGSDNFKPNFTDQRGRGSRGRRGRGVGFRQGENFGYDHRGHDFRHQFDRSQRNYEDRRGMPGAGTWEREGRQSFNTEIPRSDRGNRHTDGGDRRRFADHNEFEDIRPLRDNAENVRRLDEGHGQNIYSDEEDRRKYSDDSRKRGEEPERRRYEGRRGLEDRTDDPDVRKASDIDDYEDYKRVRKDDGKKLYERGYKEVDDGRSGRQDRDGGKHRSAALRRESPREEEMHFRSKSYDSPGKGHKKSSPKERRDREADSRRGDRDVDRRDHEVERKDRVGDRRDRDRDRDGDRRDRDGDKREVDRRVKDVDRRDRDVDRRERDDKRERDLDKPERESEKRDKEYDRKESYKKDRDQDRKLRDGDRDRREKEVDRREREPPRRERDIVNKDKIERNDSDRKDRESDKSYVSRWDHGDTKLRSDKEIEKKSKSRERERSLIHEEKEHKRKSKRKEEKEEGHHSKEKGNCPPDSENLKVEKKKHDKKKKKKEKRRASQASTEASQAEVSGDEAEDKKKKKKRERKRRAKGTPQDEAMEEEGVENKAMGNEEKFPGDGERAESMGKSVRTERTEENDSEMMTPLRGGTPDPTASEESPSTTLLPLPPLSKWERDEDLTLTPKGLVENKAPEEEKKVTVDIIKRAENTIFSGRVLAPRKVFLDPQKQKGSEEKERSPTPEWDRLELREAKRKGQSIQITISSKTENQIGRPKGGRYQSDKHSRSQKRSQSPSEPQSSTRTRRRSEKEEHTKDERERCVSADRSGANSEHTPSDHKLKADDCDNYKEPVEDGLRECTSQNSEPDAQLKMENVRETSLKPCDNHENTKPFVEVSDKSVKEERIGAQKGVKRSSSSTEELEVKKLKTEDEHFPMESEASGNISRRESIENEEKKSASIKGEPEYGIPVLGESSIKDRESSLEDVKSPKHVIHNVTNSNLVMIPMAPQEGEELEEGEIPSDSLSEEDHIPEEEEEAVLEAPLELRGVVEEEATMEESLKDFQKIRYSPIRVPSPVEPGEAKATSKVKEKSKKRKKRKRSSSSSSSNSSSSSSSSSSEEEEIVKKKKKKKKKKKIVNSDSSDGETQRKHKKKKKDKKKKKKKEKKKKSDK